MQTCNIQHAARCPTARDPQRSQDGANGRVVLTSSALGGCKLRAYAQSGLNITLHATARPERRRHDVQCAVQCGWYVAYCIVHGRHSRMGYSSVTASLRSRVWIMRLRIWIFRILVWIIRLRVWIMRKRVHGRYSRTGHALGDGIMYIDILHSSGRMVQIAGEVRAVADHSVAQQTDTRATHKRRAESRAAQLNKAVTHGSPELPCAPGASHRIRIRGVQRIRPS